MNSQIYAEAADWLVELSSSDAGADSASRERFYTWLRSSPEHVRAYLELLPAWEIGGDLPTDATLGIPELLQSGRSDAANVVSLGRAVDMGEPQATLGRPQRSRMRNFPRALAASLVVFCLAIAATVLYSRQGLYTTDIGEQQIFRLSDGTTIELNSRSKIRVRVNNTQRRVELLEGQALFQVAHDATRPFVVTADRTTVRAVGTAFDVNIKSTATVVTVVEGKVAVSSTSPDDDGARADPSSQAVSAKRVAVKRELLVAAGQQLAVAAGSGVELTPRPADVASATAWTQRRLVFDASTLADVVDEFNKYNTRHLVLKDPSLAGLPITAAFETPDPTGLIRFLRAQPDIEVAETPEAILISRK